MKILEKIKTSVLVVALVVSLVVPAFIVNGQASAAGEGFSTVADVSGKPGQQVNITNLQVTGTGNDEISVKLHVDTGELYFNNIDNVTFETYSYGTDITVNGLRADVNTALQSLVYENSDEGTYEVEVTLGDGNYNAANGHVYKVVAAAGISWADAKAAAEATEYGGSTGYLATITTQAEHDFIRERINDSGWIGATDTASEGVWRWVTGPEAGTQFWAGDETGAAFGGAYQNWNPGEPNNSGEGENCGQIYFTEESDGQWNDLDCVSEENQYYVVEFGAPGDMPTVVSRTFNIVLARNVVQVNSCDALFALGAEYAGDSIELTADIDCQGRTEAPLFDEEDFTGTFNGNGFTIKNLTLANEDNDHIGLTGYSVGAEYRNIFLDNITVNGGYHSGVLAGHVEESIIAENIHATNIHMTGSQDYGYVEEMGVLFGVVQTEHQYGQSKIEHVSVQGTFDMIGLDDVWNIGGIAGSIESESDFTLKQAYADVDITIDSISGSVQNVGGLVGYWDIDGEDDNPDKTLQQGITDSYSWGSITASTGEVVGGLIGYIENDAEDNAATSFAVNNSYSWMDITGALSVGGLIGHVANIDTAGGTMNYSINNSFYAGTLTGGQSAGIIVAHYSDFEQLDSTFTFNNVWYDAQKVEGYQCVGTMDMDECHAANANGNQPNYFINNKTNAPMDEWDFTTIWKTQQGTPPVFKPFIGNDGDQDDANDYIESRAPNSGDANNDGIQDSEQANVASFVSEQVGNYVSIVVSDECSLSRVSATAEQDNMKADEQYVYNTGFVNFTADCGVNGFTTPVEVYFYGIQKDGLVVRKYNPTTQTYMAVTTAVLSQATIGGQGVAIAAYNVTDGGDLDADGIENGVIVDPVGLASVAEAAVPNVPNTGFMATVLTPLSTVVGSFALPLIGATIVIGAGLLGLKIVRRRH